MSTVEQLKAAATAAVKAQRQRLVDVSRRIHAHPELGHEEFQAVRLLTDEFARAGFEVEEGVGELPTAFLAQLGTGALRIYVCAEYDALPGIGHACGHNMIAASALGAALGLAAVVDELDLTVVVIGTPAEEVLERGGKTLLLERGLFDAAHAAVMVHPAPFELTSPTMIAATRFALEFAGRASHASAAPELGINAADAAVITQVGIGLLRQQMSPDQRIHSIIDHAGDAPNIIPDRSTGRFMVRSPTIAELDPLKDRVLNCARGAALATGCELTVSGGDRAYHNVVHDVRLATLFAGNARTLGRSEDPRSTEVSRFQASTDMGNVSSFLPVIHPFMQVTRWPVANHQPEFAAACATEDADMTMLDAATAMAWTVIDVASDTHLATELIDAARAQPPVHVRASAM